MDVPPPQYVIGSNCATGQKIATIFGHSPNASVYTTIDSHIRWEYHAHNRQIPAELRPAIRQFDTALTTIKLRLPGRYQPVAYALLGKGLFSALDDGRGDQIAESLKDALAFIGRKAIQHARLTYLMWCFITSIAIGFTLWYFAIPHVNAVLADVLRGSIAGIFGTWISVIQRSDRLQIDSDSTYRVDATQGAARAVLGMLFGGFFVLACKADLVLGLLNSKEPALLALAVVAGFSERVVPDMIAGLERANQTSKQAAAPPGIPVQEPAQAPDARLAETPP